MRLQRQLSAETRKKISESMRGRHKSDRHKAAISRGMLHYWAQIPYLKETTEINNENEKPLNYEPMEETSND